MKVTALNKINDRLKTIPDDFANDIIKYLDFLSYKAGAGDWAMSLSGRDLELIQKGSDDLKNGRIFLHADAMKKINAHIKQKNK